LASYGKIGNEQLWFPWRLTAKSYSYGVGPLLTRWEGDRMEPAPTLQRVAQISEDSLIFLSKTGVCSFSDGPFGEGPRKLSPIHLE
jgi:hypothetical protein